MTENGAIRVRSRRFLAHLNRTGEKPNFGLILFCFFSFFRFLPPLPFFFSYLFPQKIITNNITTIIPVLGVIVILRATTTTADSTTTLIRKNGTKTSAPAPGVIQWRNGGRPYPQDGALRNDRERNLRTETEVDELYWGHLEKVAPRPDVPVVDLAPV